MLERVVLSEYERGCHFSGVNCVCGYTIWVLPRDVDILHHFDIIVKLMSVPKADFFVKNNLENHHVRLKNIGFSVGTA